MPGRHHEHRQVRIELPDTGEQVEPLLAGRRVAGVVQVDERGVEVARLEGGERGGGGGDDLALESLALEQQAQRLEHVLLVVRDEDPPRAPHDENP